VDVRSITPSNSDFRPFIPLCEPLAANIKKPAAFKTPVPTLSLYVIANQYL